MADASVTLEMLIKEGRAIVGLQSVDKAAEKVVLTTTKIGREAKKADGDLEKFVKRIQQLNASPLDKVRGQIAQLETAFAKGKISLLDYTQAKTRLVAEEKAVQAAMSGTNQKLQEQAKYFAIAEQRNKDYDAALTAAAKKGSAIYAQSVKQRIDADKKAADAQKQSFGSDAYGQLTQFAAGYITLARAAQFAGDAFRHAKEENRAALDSMRGLDPTRQGLAQLAIGQAPGTLGKWQSRADAAAIASGAPRSVAYQALHTMETYGQLNKYEEVMGAHPLVNAASGALIATKVREMTGKSHEFRPLLNMLIEAGKHSAVDAETLAGPMAIAMEGGRDIGGSAAQTASVLSVLTTYFAGRGDDAGEGKTGAARIAGDRMKTFAHKVGTRLPDLAKQKPDWIGAFEAVGKMSPGEQQEFFEENQELRAAFTAYWDSRARNREVYKATDSAGAAPLATDNVSQGLAIRAADPKSRATLKNVRSKLKQEVATENNLGISFANADAASAEAQAAAHRTGLNFWQRFGVYMAAGTAANLNMSPETTLAAGKWGGNLATVMGGGIYGGGGIDEFIPAMRRLEKDQAASKKQEAAADALLRAAQALTNAAENFGGSPTQAIQQAAQANLN